MLTNTSNNSVIAYSAIDVPTLYEFFTGNTSGLLFKNPGSVIGEDTPIGKATQNWSGYKMTWGEYTRSFANTSITNLYSSIIVSGETSIVSGKTYDFAGEYVYDKDKDCYVHYTN